MIFTALKSLLAPVSGRQAKETPTIEAAPASFPTENGVVSSVASETNVDLEAQKTSLEVREGSKGTSSLRSLWARFKPSARVIGDFTIGLSDGMTVPFALTAGLSFLNDPKLVVVAGLAELVAGTISMAIGGFLAARGEAKSYQARLAETKQDVVNMKAFGMIQDVFGRYPAVSPSTIATLFQELATSPDGLQSFLMRNHYGMAEPKTSRPWICAITIGCGYLFGGLLPLIPYFAVHQGQIRDAFYASLAIMIVALFTFGYLKSGLDKGWKGKDNVKSAFFEAGMMLLIGGAAVGLSILVILGINHKL